MNGVLYYIFYIFIKFINDEMIPNEPSYIRSEVSLVRSLTKSSFLTSEDLELRLIPNSL